MPQLPRADAEAFLTEAGHLVRIATTDGDGSPLVIPAWFIYEDGRILFTPRERSTWRRNLERDPRACLLIDEEQPPYRKVVARGQVEVVHPLGADDEWRDVYRRIAMRYVPEAWADAYLADTHDEPRSLLGLDLSTARLTTWRMPLGGEDPLAVWAPRYYHR